MTDRSLSEVAIFTPKVRETIEFYEKVIGAPPALRDEYKAIFQVGGTIVLIHTTEVARDEDHIAFVVPDLEDACRQLTASGAHVEGPADYPWGRAAYATDPDGRTVELHEPGAVSYNG